MKKVFSTHSEVAHVWNTERQNEGHASNVFFYGPAIYSYGHHFCIAKHMTSTETGQSATLFTTRGYSNSTAKHINIVRQAARNRHLIFCPFPNGSHAENFAYWRTQAYNFAVKLERAKKPGLYISEIEHIKNLAERYCNFYGISVPAELLHVFEIKDKQALKNYKDTEAQRKKEAEKMAAINAKKQHRKELKKFLNFEAYRTYTDVKIDYLRYNKETDNIETTQGVKIPSAAGRLFIELLQQNKIKEGDKIEHYQVNSITKTEIKIGCHNFKIKDIFNFYSKL